MPPPDLQAAPLSTKHPAAVLFDMDGALIDSEKLWDAALQELAAVYGGTLSDTARRAMVGAGTAASMRIMHDGLGQPERDPQASADWLNARSWNCSTPGCAGGRARWRCCPRSVRPAFPPPWSPPAPGRCVQRDEAG